MQENWVLSRIIVLIFKNIPWRKKQVLRMVSIYPSRGTSFSNNLKIRSGGEMKNYTHA